MKAELINKINGFDQDPMANSQELFDELFNELVPGQGSADTVAGEIIRACARVQYRYFNDGDKAGCGYGKETVNPAVRYLYDQAQGTHVFVIIVNNLYEGVNGKYFSDDEYEAILEDLIESAISYIAEQKLYDVENNEDMLSFRTDEDRDDSDYDY